MLDTAVEAGTALTVALTSSLSICVKLIGIG